MTSLGIALFITLILLRLDAASEPVTAYTYLAVTSFPSWAPSISSSGEVVFVARDRTGSPNVFSTKRGQLTFSSTGHLRFPSIRQGGEVVFAEWVLPSKNFGVFLTVRGLIATDGDANLPSINDRGQMCFISEAGETSIVVLSESGEQYRIRGRGSTSCDLNNHGEVVYRARDSEGRYQIFSSKRDQLTSSTGAQVGTPTVNSSGKVVYVRDGELHAVGGPQITQSAGRVGFFIDMNDQGDVVFAVRLGRDFMIALATLEPERYPEFQSIDIAMRAPLADANQGDGEGWCPKN